MDPTETTATPAPNVDAGSSADAAPAGGFGFKKRVKVGNARKRPADDGSGGEAERDGGDGKSKDDDDRKRAPLDEHTCAVPEKTTNRAGGAALGGWDVAPSDGGGPQGAQDHGWTACRCGKAQKPSQCAHMLRVRD